ncbi:MAG: hypothetical protein ACYC6M_16560 [Terriglobales bacterium]
MKIRTVLVGALVPLLLAGPASAAVPKTKPNPDWVRRTFPCRKGHKAAVIAYSPTHSFLLPNPDPNSDAPIYNPHAWAGWFKNPCPGQWLVWAADGTPSSSAGFTAQTGTSGKLGGADFWVAGGAFLADTSGCESVDNPAGVHAIMRKGQKFPAGCY